MPPKLIVRIKGIAKDASTVENRHVSFSEIVMRALNKYTPQFSDSNDKMLETLLDGIISSTNNTVKSIRQLNKRLDASYVKINSNFY